MRSAQPTANICTTCHSVMVGRLVAGDRRTAFALGAIVAAVPLLFLLTAPGATHPGLWARLGIWVGGGLAGLLIWWRRPRVRICLRCRQNPSDTWYRF